MPLVRRTQRDGAWRTQRNLSGRSALHTGSLAVHQWLCIELHLLMRCHVMFEPQLMKLQA